MKTIIAIIVVGALLLTALWNGIDGVLMASGIAVIAGLGGFYVRKKTK